MKKITSIIAIVALSIAFSSSAVAQSTPSTATSVTSATIVAPIVITNLVKMNFGKFATTGAGTLTLDTNNGRLATDAVKVTGTGTNTATTAKLHVTGEPSYAYTISTPADFSLTTTSVIGGAIKTMAVSGFTLAFTAGTVVPFSTAGTLSTTAVVDGPAAGTQDFYVGATLAVVADQAVGTYTSDAGFAVTVNYN